ncbi:MAG: hypothetical protein LBD41_01720, partial [Clostridiales Family XIII bacterium]|nr:hypothetical protein [Clostridiales Family XIII bacterium]
MQILYGNVQTNITRELVKRAELSGKQVFYLVPTSISVEKESEVLSLLKNHTAIDIQVLSFKRLAWFFLRNDKYYKEVKLTEVGRVMLFRKTLEEMKEQDLGEYSGLKGNIGFIEELSKLHNDIKNAGLSVDALIGEEKFEILRKIMTNFEENLKGNFRLENEISLLKEKIKEIKNFKAENILIIIDGYSRLTGSERELLDEFQSLGVEILLGTYISKRALKQQNISGNIYEDAIKFVNTFRN